MADLQYYDIDGNPISLHALCRREPLWAANRIRTDQAEVAALRDERDALRALVLRMRTAMCAWSADEDGTVHGDAADAFNEASLVLGLPTLSDYDKLTTEDHDHG